MTDDSDDNGGYGKPPKKHRFVKGTSGNPAGSRRRKTTRAEIVAKVRDAPIEIVVNGQRKKVTSFEAAITATLNRTLKSGHPRDLQVLMQIMEKYGASPAADRREQSERDAAAVTAKILQYFDRTNGG